ncbi:MAG: hypothetical protein ACOYBY_16840 [Dermatophilaceae bacterium]
MNATPAGLDTVKTTFGRVVTTLAGEPARPSVAHLVLDEVSSRVSVDPLTATSESTIVFEPVAIDSSVRVELGELPPTEVRSPYEQTWSWSVLGHELFSLTIRGLVTTHVTPGEPDRARYRVVDVGGRAPAAAGTSDVTVALPAGER